MALTKHEKESGTVKDAKGKLLELVEALTEDEAAYALLMLSNLFRKEEK